MLGIHQHTCMLHILHIYIYIYNRPKVRYSVPPRHVAHMWAQILGILHVTFHYYMEMNGEAVAIHTPITSSPLARKHLQVRNGRDWLACRLARCRLNRCACCSNRSNSQKHTILTGRSNKRINRQWPVRTSDAPILDGSTSSSVVGVQSS